MSASSVTASSKALLLAPAMHTRITKLFNCRYPIVLPGMSWISRAELVAAVSNAGGVGILATGPLSAHETAQEIDKIRSLLTKPDLPFGVGITLLMPGAVENAKAALKAQVPIINTSLGKADWIAHELHEYGGKLICTVTNRHHATVAVEQSNANALMVVGHEAAAHGGDVTSLCLVPALYEALGGDKGSASAVPIIAAGGLANGRGLAAALALGADGVAMGSRLAVTLESPLHDSTKQAIVNANESQTIYGSNFDGIPARVLSTPTAQQLMQSRPWLPVIVYRAIKAARDMNNMPLWKVLGGLLTHFDKLYVVAQFGAATDYLTQATIHGNLQQGVQFIGQSTGLINDIPTVHDLIQRMVHEAQETAVYQTQHVFGKEDRDGEGRD